MGETRSHSGFTQPNIASLVAVCALLLLCTTLLPTASHAMNTDESALMQRLPVALKITATQARNRIRHWQTFVEDVRHKSEMDKLVAVNHYFNTLRFIEDVKLWHQPDYWATPLQVLAVGAGDCEDLAIAKYFTLRTLGVTNERLRITYVWNHDALSGRRLPHMVLTYIASADADPLVLDIITLDIQSLSQRKDLEPVYSINSEGLWLVADNARAISAGSPAQLSQWRQLSLDMEGDTALLEIQ
jgi:predicted transglutaminase-like cysteine proteinase